MTAVSTAALDGPDTSAAVLAELRAIRERLDALQMQVVRDTPLQAQLDGFSSATRDWLRRVMGLVVEEFCVPLSDLTGPARHPVFIKARFTLIWLLRRATGYSLPQLARLVNRTDNATIIHAMRRVEGWRDTDAEYRRLTDALLDDVRALRGELFRNPHEAQPQGETA